MNLNDVKLVEEYADLIPDRGAQTSKISISKSGRQGEGNRYCEAWHVDDIQEWLLSADM